MKTKNNVQKAISKSMAVVISLVLLSFTVNAQNFWKTLLENNSFNEIAMVMTETKLNDSKMEAISAADASSFAALLEVETENPMELEDWMTDANYFDSDIFLFETESDESLELENWMTNDNYFYNSTFKVIEEIEEPLELETWMINFGENESENEGNKSYSDFSIEQEMENELELEPWMTNNNYWN